MVIEKYRQIEFYEEGVCQVKGFRGGKLVCTTHHCEIRACAWCGRFFHIWNGRHKTKRYCSAPCRYQFHNNVKEGENQCHSKIG